MRTGDLTTTARPGQCVSPARAGGWRRAPVRPAWSPSECGSLRRLRATSCAPPEHADHATQDLDVRAADRLEVLVLRLEADVVALAEVALHGRLSFGFRLGVDERHH